MFLNGVHIRGVQQAKTDTGLFVIEQIHMRNSELVYGRFAELSQVVLCKGNLVNVKENGHQIFRA
jgi:hypothetical protein